MEISFKDITRVIKKNIVFILVVSCLFAIISVFVTTFFIQKTYTSSVKLYVETNYNTSSAMEDNQSVNYAKNLVLTYIESSRFKHILQRGFKGAPRKIHSVTAQNYD